MSCNDQANLFRMADPFGIVAVSITSLKVAKGLHDLIIDLHNVPNELLALSNEICNLKFVLDSTQEIIREEGEAGIAKYDKLGPLLFQARVKLDQLDNLLAKWGKLGPWGDSFSVKKLDRLFWMKERKTVWELQKQFREIRNNLSVLLEASSL